MRLRQRYLLWQYWVTSIDHHTIAFPIAMLVQIIVFELSKALWSSYIYFQYLVDNVFLI